MAPKPGRPPGEPRDRDLRPANARIWGVDVEARFRRSPGTGSARGWCRALIITPLLLALSAGAAPAREAGGTPVAFVAAEKASELVAVDLTTGRVVGRIRMPSGPRNVAATGDLRYLLVTSPRAGTVTVIDSFTQRIVKTFRGFGHPNDVAVEADYAYVTDSRRGQLIVIELARRRIVARVGVGRQPVSVAVGDVALVAHRPPNPNLTVVDLRRPRTPRVSRLAVPAVGGARDISERADSANAYVTGWSSGGVGGIDWGNRRVLWWRKVGVAVRDVAFDYFHGRRVWVSDVHAGEVIALSSNEGRVLRRLRGCSGAGPIAFGGQAWVAASCRNGQGLAVWDTRRWRRTLVPIGGNPYGVAVAVVP